MEKAMLQTPLGKLIVEGNTLGLTSLYFVSDETNLISKRHRFSTKSMAKTT